MELLYLPPGYVQVGPGELLYLPSMWHHYVEQRTTPPGRDYVVAVNFWGVGGQSPAGMCMGEHGLSWSGPEGCLAAIFMEQSQIHLLAWAMGK